VTKDASLLLDTFAGFLVEAGLSRKAVAQELSECAERASRRTPRLMADTQQPVVQLAGALRQWWQDPEYVDDDGYPRPLPLTGPGLSVESLVARHVAKDLRHEAIATLRKSVVITRKGLWKPQSSRPFVRAFGEEGTRRLQVSLAGVLQTFLRNQLSVSAVGQKNFDRTASVPSFPDALLPELRQRLNRLLMVTLEDVDRILSETDTGAHRGGRSEVGVSILLYDFPQQRRAASRRTDCSPGAENVPPRKR
jgi:hypothetical protein